MEVIICATDTNARHAIGFRDPLQISRDIKTGVGCDPYLLLTLTREMVMASRKKWGWRSPFALSLMPAAAVLCASAALGSQGPGTGPGTASPFTQLVMTIIVYGTSALVVGAGLIGAAGRHRAGRGP